MDESTPSVQPESEACASRRIDSQLTGPHILQSYSEQGHGDPATGSPTIPGYEILALLGKGGMGEVYKARDLRLNRLVAVKMIRARGRLSREAMNRFGSEAQAMGCLQHPNIIQIYMVGEYDYQPYLLLEYVEGGSLAQKLHETSLSSRQSAQLIEVVARAMHYAHQRGIVHRDLKPANILLTADGMPKVGDFGLAQLMPEAYLVVPMRPIFVDPGLTRGEMEAWEYAIKRKAGDCSNYIAGTPSYMAPEQAEGRVWDYRPQTDIYELGAILYEMLTGRPPFIGVTVEDILQQIVSDEPVRPSRLQPKVPRDIETICLTCLRKEPGQRYRTAESLADDLRRFLDGEAIQARPIDIPIGNSDELVKVTAFPECLLPETTGCTGQSAPQGGCTLSKESSEPQEALYAFGPLVGPLASLLHKHIATGSPLATAFTALVGGICGVVASLIVARAIEEIWWYFLVPGSCLGTLLGASLGALLSKDDHRQGDC